MEFFDWFAIPSLLFSMKAISFAITGLLVYLAIDFVCEMTKSSEPELINLTCESRGHNEMTAPHSCKLRFSDGLLTVDYVTVCKRCAKYTVYYTDGTVRQFPSDSRSRAIAELE